MATSPYTLTVAEAAQLAGVSRHTIYRGIKAGHIPAVRLGTAVRVKRVPFLKLIAAEDALARAEAELAEAS